MKKILYFGGQKSGKSLLSEKKTLEIAQNKPYYVATYDNSYRDSEMENRIEKHRLQREEGFITVEEPKDIAGIIKDEQTYLIDCLSMWILNNMENEQELFDQIERLKNAKANIVFVLNEVTSGVIPMDKQSRKFVDLTGMVGQKIVEICDEVYEVKFSLEKRLK